VREKDNLSSNIFERLCQIAHQAMVCQKAGSSDARKIGLVMGMMNGSVPFEVSSRLYRMTI
jgi:hypothetical protein